MEKTKTLLTLVWIAIEDFMNTPITDPKFDHYLNIITITSVSILLVILAWFVYLLKKKQKEEAKENNEIL